MGSKIKVGDWVISRISGECSFVDSENFAHNANTCRGYAKAPASPADMAKSHRLLMRWWSAYSGSGDTAELWVAIDRHCRRLTTKQSRRGGEGACEVKLKPVKRLMYMGVRRRPLATTLVYEDYGYASDMAKYCASVQGGMWRVVPVQVIELPSAGKYNEHGEPA